MAYIQADYTKFEAAAKAIDEYVSTLKSKMGSADGAVKTLAATWQGSDFTQFQSQWEKVDENGSVYADMVKDLKNYAEYLRYAAEQYKKAQAKALDLASRLSK